MLTRLGLSLVLVQAAPQIEINVGLKECELVCKTKECPKPECLNGESYKKVDERGAGVFFEAPKFEWACKCPDGFRGQTCEIPSPCNAEPCSRKSHGGSVKTGECEPNEDWTDYTCKCNPQHKWYTGKNCHVQQKCKWSPCKNGAKCTDIISSDSSSYTCDCPAGYTGRRCSAKVVEATTAIIQKGPSTVATNAPTTQSPTTAAKTTKAATTVAPTTTKPATVVTTTDAPTTAAPTTAAPTTKAPTTAVYPATEAPTTKLETTEKHTTTTVFVPEPTPEKTEPATLPPPMTLPPTKPPTKAPTTGNPDPPKPATTVAAAKPATTAAQTTGTEVADYYTDDPNSDGDNDTNADFDLWG